MPLQTATPARIRRSIREADYARVMDGSVLVLHPTASDGYSSVLDGFWDTLADAQVLLNERAGILMVPRRREAIETDSPLRIGQTLALAPALPKARVIDKDLEVDRTMIIKGLSVDLGADRNAIEVIG